MYFQLVSGQLRNLLQCYQSQIKHYAGNINKEKCYYKYSRWVTVSPLHGCYQVPGRLRRAGQPGPGWAQKNTHEQQKQSPPLQPRVLGSLPCTSTNKIQYLTQKDHSLQLLRPLDKSTQYYTHYLQIVHQWIKKYTDFTNSWRKHSAGKCRAQGSHTLHLLHHFTKALMGTTLPLERDGRNSGAGVQAGGQPRASPQQHFPGEATSGTNISSGCSHMRFLSDEFPRWELSTCI